MTVELYGNGGQTTLSAARDSVETTLTVQSASGFPSGSGRYRIRVDDELMIVTNGLGTTTWTVTRGAEGTTATSHASGATVRHVLTAGALPASLHASRSVNTATAGQDRLTLGATPYEESLQIWKNGAMLSGGYSVSGKVITLSPALAAGDIIIDHYWTTTISPADSALSTALTYADVILADSPIAYYRLGEASGTVAADATANNLAGTYVNSPTLGVAGLIRGDTNTSITTASGSSHHVVTATNNLLERPNMMVELWMKTTTIGVVARDATGTNGWFLNMPDATGSVTLRISGANYTTTVAVSALIDGAKHHVVFGADTTTVYLYVDGAASWSAARSGTAVACVDPWYLAKNGTTAQFASGTWDEWAFYETLTAARVTEHYNAGA